MSKKTLLLSSMIPLLILSLAGCQWLPMVNNPQPTLNPLPTTSVLAPSTTLNLQDSQDRLVSIYEQVNPGVVAIQVTTEQGGAFGSGFVFDKQGHIVTNAHVVEGATFLEVDFPSGLKTEGTVAGVDLDSDIAVITVNVSAEFLSPLTMGDSNNVKVGQYAIAIGNPFLLDSSMTLGIVSAKGRQMQSLHKTPSGGYFTAGDLIQTDAAINPGNSGGPLLDLEGQVIGINRAIQTSSNTTVGGEPGNIGIGFAIPINIAKRVVPSLIAEGHYDYPYVGITSRDSFTLDELKVLGLPEFQGLYVLAVANGSPAQKAGIIAGSTETTIPDLLAGGDVITAVDGMVIHSFTEFLGYLFQNKGPGDNVVFSILRDNKSVEVTLTLTNRPK